MEKSGSADCFVMFRVVTILVTTFFGIGTNVLGSTYFKRLNFVPVVITKYCSPSVVFFSITLHEFLFLFIYSQGKVPVKWLAVESLEQGLYTSQSDV